MPFVVFVVIIVRYNKYEIILIIGLDNCDHDKRLMKDNKYRVINVG